MFQRRTILFSLLTLLFLHPTLAGDTLRVEQFRHVGPYPILTPHLVDSTGIDGKGFDAFSLLDGTLPFDAVRRAPVTATLPADDEQALHLAAFYLQTSDYLKATVSVEGPRHRLFVDGRRTDNGQLKLEPATHEVVIAYLSDTTAAPAVSVVGDHLQSVAVTDGTDRLFSLDINTQGEGISSVSVSPDGRWAIVKHSLTDRRGRVSSYCRVMPVGNLKKSAAPAADEGWTSTDDLRWMPRSAKLYFTRSTVEGRQLLAADPATGRETLLAASLPAGDFRIAPTEDALYYTVTKEGPREGDVHQILTPDDRQPGWRNRCYLTRYDLATGIMQPLTFGWHNSWLLDVSDDGSQLLVLTSRDSLTTRPTTRYSILLMDSRTLAVTPLVEDDGFVSEGCFSPDGRQVLLAGSPEALGGVGNALPDSITPSMIDKQLFLMDIATRDVRPLTLHFDPCVIDYRWSRADGRIYLSAEEGDCKNLFRLDPATARAERLPNQEEYLYGFSVASQSPLLAYWGQSLCNGDRAYLLDTRSLRQQTLLDVHATRFADVTMGEGGGYSFVTSRGDTITAFYVLPPHFDATKCYPMLVHYYGGCSPSSRYAVGSYSPQYYAAQGYIFLVINPSGATGFGQEFSARHVNTAGDVVADDIIEATQHFCVDHPYVDTDHIGCFSASYGGFMTQLLLSKTDLYATGISHAGISDHTSYWGEGYWGYSYSEISMANSYPWTRRDLYVDRSPLYFADRIHTPLLFLHGSADTNVPIGESIQMFTALKLIGTETAFVVVDGENHGIRDYEKRRQWLRTISAWFARYLKEDSTWWDELYPPKKL